MSAREKKTIKMKREAIYKNKHLSFTPSRPCGILDMCERIESEVTLKREWLMLADKKQLKFSRCSYEVKSVLKI